MNDQEFTEYLENKVIQTIEGYGLLSKDEKILVALSGGKDSTTVLHILHKLGYTVEGITVDARIGCYTEKNLKNTWNVCDEIGVKLHEINFVKEFGGALQHLLKVLKRKGINLKSCNVCGTLRRFLINKRARELGVDKVVTGHNLDDEAQVFIMNLFKNTLHLSARMGPKAGLIKDEMFVKRVKPLYFLSENEIIRYVKIRKFPVYIGKCPCSLEGQRNFFKDWLNEIEERNPEVKGNIINYFLKVLPMLQERYKGKGGLQYCEECGEPSSQKICRTCQLLAHFERNPGELAHQEETCEGLLTP